MVPIMSGGYKVTSASWANTFPKAKREVRANPLTRGWLLVMRRFLLRGRFPYIARGRRPHGHEFFGRGRMQRKRGIEIGLGRFHFDGNADGLHDLGGGIADDVATD